MKKFEVGMIKSYTDIFGGEEIEIVIKKIEDGMIYYTEYVEIPFDGDKPIERDLICKEIEIDNDSERFKIWSYRGICGYIYAKENY